MTDGTFVAYEYTTVKVDRDLETLYRDTYQNFGWIAEGTAGALPGSPTVSLKFKRDRLIGRDRDLVNLQRQCDSALRTISSLEHKKVIWPTMASISVGIVGSGFLAGSVFTLEDDHIAISVILGVIGLISWVAGYFTNGAVKRHKITQLTPQIELQYDIVYDTSEQANRLLG